MHLAECTLEDAPRLARMNKRLIDDERSENPMGVPELEARMRSFLDGEYTAYLFIESEETVGYALVRRTVSPPYLRQFYIEREHRRRHYGQRAFRLLLEALGTDTMDLDVLPWNGAGRAFWKSCGLRETCVSMRYTR